MNLDRSDVLFRGNMMDSGVVLSVGIVVSREAVDHPWDGINWRPVGVLLGAPAKAVWREVARGRDYAHYHAATVPLTLDPRCAMNYRVNLANGVPSVYVVVRQRPGAGADVPIDITRASVSPFEIDAQRLDASEHIERVPMPPELVDIVQRFIDGCVAQQSDARPAGRQRREARDEKLGGGYGLGFTGQLSPGK